MFLSDPPANDAVHALYEASRSEDGYVTNFLRVWAWRPDVFRAFREMRTSLASRTTLSEREIAVLNATTASRLGDGYCSIAWGSKLAKLTTPAVAAPRRRAAAAQRARYRAHALGCSHARGSECDDA